MQPNYVFDRKYGGHVSNESIIEGRKPVDAVFVLRRKMDIHAQAACCSTQEHSAGRRFLG
jgi:hypothetical protein